MDFQTATHDARLVLTSLLPPTIGRQKPAMGSLCAAITVLERMRGKFPLENSDYLTRSGGEVSRMKAHVETVMARFNETRRLPSEVGRTNRSTAALAKDIVGALTALPSFAGLNERTRELVIHELHADLVKDMQWHLDRPALQIQVNLALAAALIVEDILEAAARKQIGGAVAQHLVGAKLALRFPNMVIPNHPYTAADVPTGRPGDFDLGDVVLHVTIRETSGHIEKCKRNFRDGKRPYLLVPKDRILVADQMVKDNDAKGKVLVSSIESFVGQNVEEIGEFTQEGLKANMRALLEKYNFRVAEAEPSNPGFQIEIPSNLL